MIVLKNITKKFGNAAALLNVSLRIEPKELVCLIGGAGSGKSTLLSLLIAADTTTSGSVEVDGVDLTIVPPPALQLYRRRVGMMFQDRKLLPQRTVSENLSFPLEVTGSPERLIQKRVPALLAYLGLLEKKQAFPHNLSLFEQAKLALGRAIIHKPLIFMADEPTAGLTAQEARTVLSLLKEIHASGVSVIIASRDATLASTLNARTVTLERGRLVSDTQTIKEKTDMAATESPPSTNHEKIEELLTREKVVRDAQKPVKIPERMNAMSKVKITSIGAL